MSKIYLLKIEDCCDCPQFEHMYKNNNFHCRITDKIVKYKKRGEEYSLRKRDIAMQKLLDECPLMDWSDEKTKMCLGLYDCIDKIRSIDLNVKVDD